MTNTLSTTFTYIEALGSTDSSVIYDAFYNSDDNSLVIELTNGSLLGYSGVASSTWQAFKSASSQGSFWNRYIKSNKMFGRFDVDGLSLVPAVASGGGAVGSVNSAPVTPDVTTANTYVVEVVVRADSLSAAAAQVEAAGLNVTGVRSQ